jgi:hypothetical protein
MFVEEGLAPRDQLALYAHALGHGLLNEEARRLGQDALPWTRATGMPTGSCWAS